MTHRIALFGAGRIGRIHAANIAAHTSTQLVAVVDPVASVAASLAQSYGAVVQETEQVLARTDVDAIVVASATATHAELIVRGLGAGKAVFCEKPIDLDIERVRQTLRSVPAGAPPLVIGFNRRFDPSIARAAAAARAGEVGEIELVTINSKDPGALPIEYLKESGGMWRDMTIHDFDIARFLLGEEPVSVFAEASALTDPAIRELGDIDTSVVTLRTASGKLAVIVNSRRASFGYDQRIEIHGSTGLLRVENLPQTTTSLANDRGVMHDKPLFFFLERYDRSYAVEWDNFVSVLDGRSAPNPSGEDGLRALLLAEAAYRSFESGRRTDVAAG